MEEMLLKIRTEKSADAIKTILSDLGIDVKIVKSGIRSSIAGEPYTEDEIESHIALAKEQVAQGNYYTIDEVKESVNRRIQSR